MGNKTEIIFALFLMIFGVGLYSYTIGNLSSLFANMDAREAKLNVLYIYIYICIYINIVKDSGIK